MCKEELQNYYDVLLQDKELSHPLSFAEYKEAETTKHIKTFENALSVSLSIFNIKYFPRNFKRK